MSGSWIVHGEEVVYGSPWVSLHLADLETPSGNRHQYHVIRRSTGGAGAVVLDERGHILLIRRYRFVIRSWGWELPSGRLEPGEVPEVGAAREVLEETGWEPTELAHLVSLRPNPGLGDMISHVYLARQATYRGEPTDPDEAAEIHWFPLDEVRDLLRRGEIHDAFSMCGLMWLFTFGT